MAVEYSPPPDNLACTTLALIQVGNTNLKATDWGAIGLAERSSERYAIIPKLSGEHSLGSFAPRDIAVPRPWALGCKCLQVWTPASGGQ